MRTRTLFLLLLLVPVVLWAAAEPLGLRGTATPAGTHVRYPVTGLVVARPDGPTVRIAHDDIPNFMPAMTMPFTVEPADAVARLTPGDRVQFTLLVGPDSTRAIDMVVVGRDPIGLRRLTVESARTDVRLREGDAVAPFRLVDQLGAAATEADLQGVVTVATFIFTRCPLPDFCPAMMTKLKHLHAQTRADAGLASRLRLVAITIDPEFDTPAILAEYAKALRVSAPDIRLLTGDRGEIDALTAAFAVVARPSAVSIDHTLTTAVIGPDGRVATLLRGNSWSVDEALTVVRAQAGR